jgi:hypothetical protein
VSGGLLGRAVNHSEVFNAGLASAVLTLLLLLVGRITHLPPWYRDLAKVTGLLGAALTGVGIVTAHFWPPTTSSDQLMVSFDNSDRATQQVFFDASAGRPIEFESGRDTADREAVCAARKALNDGGSRVAIVVGSHDSQPLRPATQLRFSSNAGLAQRRAYAVQQLILDNKDASCRVPSVQTVVVMSVAPLGLGTLKDDRIVKVYGLGVPVRNESPAAEKARSSH